MTPITKSVMESVKEVLHNYIIEIQNEKMLKEVKGDKDILVKMLSFYLGLVDTLLTYDPPEKDAVPIVIVTLLFATGNFKRMETYLEMSREFQGHVARELSNARKFSS